MRDFIFVALLALAIISVSYWMLSNSWKPQPRDLFIVNTSSARLKYSRNRPFVLVLTEYVYTALPFMPYEPVSHPWEWKWTMEFLLENRHKEDLELEVCLEVVEPDPYGPNPDARGRGGGTTILAKSSRRTEARLSSYRRTLERDMIPQGIYRIWAETEIEVVKNNEVKTYRFEWDLGEVWVNRTDYLNIPDKVRGEEYRTQTGLIARLASAM
jgi:hypothetical protein